MSSAPLERLATREMALSRDESAADERALSALAAIPQTAMQTAERLQKMREVSVASQMRMEALEQKRLELGRRMQESSAIIALRQQQAGAAAAKTQADAMKLQLERDEFMFKKEQEADDQTMDRARTMPAGFYMEDVYDPERDLFYQRRPPPAGKKEYGREYKSAEESAQIKRRQDAEVGALEALKTQRERGPAGREIDEKGRAVRNFRDMSESAQRTIDSLPRELKDMTPDDMRRVEQAKAMQDAAFADLQKAYGAGGAKQTNPFAARGVTEEQWQALKAKNLAPEQVDAWLKSQGR